MDANNINTGMSMKADEFTWFKQTPSAHIEGVKFSAPDFSIPPTPASSYSNLHVVLDTVHPSVQTTTRGVTSVPSYYGRPSSMNIPVSSFEPTPSNFSVTPSAPSMTSRDIKIDVQSSPSSSLIRDNRLDDVPANNFRAVLEPVNPELPGARASDALTSLKSEIAPIPVPFVALEEDFDELAERTDRGLPEAVDIGLVDESMQLADKWSQVADDIRHKNWMLHHNGPVHDSNWDRVGEQVKNKNWNLTHQGPAHNANWDRVGEQVKNKDWNLHHNAPVHNANWDRVGEQVKNKNWQLKRQPLASPWEYKSWRLLDGLEEAERRWRSARGINGMWSGRINRVHHELLQSVVPIGWYQWFQNLKNKIANKSSDLANSASQIKGAASELIDAVEEEAAIDYAAAKDSAKGLAGRVADNLVADYEIAKDAASSLADSAMNAASTLAGSAKGLADTASNVIADKIVDLTTTPIDKFEGPLGGTSDFYAPVMNRQVPQMIIVMEERERADRMSRGINPIVSGLWHRLGREMLHTYRDDLADLFRGLRLNLSRKGQNLLGNIKSLENYKAPSQLIAPRGVAYEYSPVDFTFKSRRVPYEIIQMEETERADRMMRGINPIISGLWYRLGLELKYKYSLRPTIASAASTIMGVASDLAGRAAEKISDISENVFEKSKELTTPAPVNEFTAPHLNLFAYTAEPIDFSFKSSRTPSDIIALEEKERADRINEGVDVLAYSKWNALLSAPHKTIGDAPSMIPSVLPTLSAAKESLVQSGKGLTGYFGSWAHTLTDKAASMLDAAKHTHIAEVAMEYVHPDPASISSLNKAEELERTRRMSLKVDPIVAARNGRVQEELLSTIKSV